MLALASLEEAVNHFRQQDAKSSFAEYRRSRDSLIQRFEYCSDIFWKFLNDYLRHHMTIEAEIARLKIIFKESTAVGLITNDELLLCNRLIKDRNRTSHTYHEQLAEHIAHKISSYYALMSTIATRLTALES